MVVSVWNIVCDVWCMVYDVWCLGYRFCLILEMDYKCDIVLRASIVYSFVSQTSPISFRCLMFILSCLVICCISISVCAACLCFIAILNCLLNAFVICLYVLTVLLLNNFMVLFCLLLFNSYIIYI